MTLAELRTAVKAFGYGNEDDTFLTSWINTAYQDVAGRARWRWTEGISTVTTTGGLPTTTLPTSLYFGDLRSITSGLATPYYINNKSEMDDLHLRTGLVNGTPQAYTILGPVIYWYPIPNAVYSYRLYVWNAPTLLAADGDTPTLPANFHQVLVLGAMMLASMRDHDTGRAQFYEGRYERMIQQMIMKDQARTTDSQHLYLPSGYAGLYDQRR